MSTTVKSYEHSPYWLQTSNTTLNGVQTSNANTTNSVSVFNDASQTQNAQNTHNSVLSDACDDGKDDGKISLWSGICAFGKGIVKSAVNTVVGIATDPKKLIATVATAAVCIAFPPAGVALGVVGAVTGGVSLVKSAATAYDIYKNGGTDAETKAAIQDAGAATLQIGLSVAGTKASLNAMKGTAGSAMNQLGEKAGFKATAKAFWKDVRTGGRGNGGEGYLATRAYTTIKNNVKSEGGFFKGLQKTATEGWDKVKTARAERAAQKEWNKFDKADEAGKQQMVENMDKQMTDANTKLTEAQKNLAEVKGKQGVTEAEIKAAETRVTNAENNIADLKAFRQAVEDTGMKSIEAQSRLDGAKANVEAAQKALEGVAKDAPEYAKLNGELTTAQNTLKQLQTEARMTSSNPITYNGQKFANTAAAAGYNSSFGALTTPVATANMITNAEDMTLETAQYNAAVNNATNFGSVTNSSSRTFNTQFEHRDYAAMAEQASADVMKTLNYYGY